MSTNYYLRRKPTINEVENVKCLADNTLNGTNFKDILNYVNDLYSESVIHIGKRATGWKFLWCANVTRKHGKIVKMYELNRKAITAFIMQDEYVIVNEYDEVIDKNDFLDMAFNWETDGYDSVRYNLEKESGYRFDETKHQEIFKELGYKFNYIWQSDFYSDGLRFSTLDSFS